MDRDDESKKTVLTEEEATDLTISDVVYQDSQTRSNYGSIDGFKYELDLSADIERELTDKGIDPIHTGFRSGVFHNPETGEWKIAFAGTNEWGDFVQDTNFVTGEHVYEGFDITQQAVALEYTAAALSELNRLEVPLENVTTTGHSLGGGEVDLIAVAFGLDGSSWNAPGTSRIVENPDFDAHVQKLLNEDYPELQNYARPGQGEVVAHVELGDRVSDVSGIAPTGERSAVVQVHTYENVPGGTATHDEVIDRAVEEMANPMVSGLGVITSEAVSGFWIQHKLGGFYQAMDPAEVVAAGARMAEARGEYDVQVVKGADSSTPTLYLDGMLFVKTDSGWHSQVGHVMHAPLDAQSASVLDAHLALNAANSNTLFNPEEFVQAYVSVGDPVLQQDMLDNYRNTGSFDHGADLDAWMNSETYIESVMPYDKDFDGQIDSNKVFNEDGELSVNYILAQDTPDNRQAFLQSDANPDFAGNMSVEDMQREWDAAYYGYLKEEAKNEAVLETGLDYAEINDLNVPGNPNAPGYNYQPEETDDGEWTAAEKAWHQNLSDNLEVGRLMCQPCAAVTISGA